MIERKTSHHILGMSGNLLEPLKMKSYISCSEDEQLVQQGVMMSPRNG